MEIDSLSTENTPRKRPLGRRIWRAIWITCVALMVFPHLLLIMYKWVNPPLTPLMVQRFGQQLTEKGRKVNFERDYVRIDNISPHLVNAVVASEDGNFMRHKGFEVKQMKAAYRENKQGRRLRGGSTISMQTAKNAFLPHKRSMLRKGLEAYFTVLIEKVWGKKRIMEVYLNIIEFGDGIYGCEAAAQHYFGHSAADLTRHEAAQLAVTLPAPLKRNPGNKTPYFRRQTGVIQARAASYGRVNLDKKPEPKPGKEPEGLWDFVRWYWEQERSNHR